MARCSRFFFPLLIVLPLSIIKCAVETVVEELHEGSLSTGLCLRRHSMV